MVSKTTQTVPSRRHYEMLGIALAVLVLALVLEVHDDHYVSLPGFADYPVPETCMSRQWFGVACPGCGLTRSLIYLAHGDWDASLRMHRIGWLIALALLIQIPYRVLALTLGMTLPSGFCRLFGTAIIGLLLGNWLLTALNLGFVGSS